MTKQRKIARAMLISLVSILFLLLLTAGWIQTRVFKNELRDFILRNSRMLLNGEMSIERIDGDFFSHFVISGLFLKTAGDTLMYVPQFSVRYSLFRLLKREISLDTVFVDSPVLKLRQNPDNTWNFDGIFAVDSSKTSEQRSTGKPSNTRYVLRDFRIKNARIEISAQESIIPRQVTDMDIRLSAGISPDSQEISLQTFRFKAAQPDFQLRDLSFLLSRRENGIELSRFVLKTGKNDVFAEGYCAESDSLRCGLTLRSEPFDLTELQLILPDIRLYGNPVFSLFSRLSDDSLRTTLEITEGRQRVMLTTEIANFKDLVGGSPALARYSVTGAFRDVDVARWTGDADKDYVVSGDLSLQGAGISVHDADAVLRVRLSDCLLKKRRLEKAAVDAVYRRGALTGEFSVLGDAGNFDITAAVADFGGENRFSVEADAVHLDLSALLLDDSLSTDIDMNFSAHGVGFTAEDFEGEVALSLSPSTILGVGIDTLSAGVRSSAGVYTLDSLFLDTPWIRLDMDGSAGLRAPIDLRFESRLKDLSPLHHLIKADTLQALGVFSGRVTGLLDSLAVASRYSLVDVRYGATSAGILKGEAFARLNREAIVGGVWMEIDSLAMGEIAVRHIDLQTSYDQGQLDVSTDVAVSDSLTAGIQAIVVSDSVLRVGIPKIEFDIRGIRWTGGSPDMQFIVGGDRYRIDNFELKSTGASPAQVLSLDGFFSANDREDLRVRVTEFDLGVLDVFNLPPVEVLGRLSLDLGITGTADVPRISGSLSIRDGKVDRLLFDQLGGRFDYDDKQLTCSFFLYPGYLDTLVIDGILPLDLSLRNGRALLNEKRPAEIGLRAEGLSLAALLSPVKQIQSADGTVICDIRGQNTPAGLRADGFLRVINGSFAIPDMGVVYDKFDLGVSVADRRISLDSLSARQNRGSFRASGFVDIDSSFISGNISSTHIDVTADNFYLTRNRDYEIQISGDTRIRGTEFGGSIRVLRSSFYLPALSAQNTDATKEKLSDPVLVRISQSSIESTDLPDEKAIVTGQKADGNKNPLLSVLHGTVHVSVPRNTWLKSPEMKMEIAGDLDLVKSGDNVEIFGNISIVRGHYNLYGKRFKIIEGRFSFQGGREINPEITLSTEYIFRTAAREKKRLKLDVSGKALNPTLTFTLDGAEIDEGDAISYIVFGRSKEELSYGQQTGMADTGEGGSARGMLVMGVVSNVLSKKLRQTLGNKFDLDIIEINVQDNWHGAAFTVGKYLTNDLFMSYQREFGERGDDEVVPQTITLEYQLTRILFLQLLEGDTKTSGFDVIFKLER